MNYPCLEPLQVGVEPLHPVRPSLVGLEEELGALLRRQRRHLLSGGGLALVQGLVGAAVLAALAGHGGALAQAVHVAGIKKGPIQREDCGMRRSFRFLNVD